MCVKTNDVKMGRVFVAHFGLFANVLLGRAHPKAGGSASEARGKDDSNIGSRHNLF